MKLLLVACSLFLCSAASAQHKLEKLWETDSVLAVPESVLPDAKKNVLYVSLIDGDPWAVDGKGGIAKLNKKGKIINSYWIKGLNAPKGMAQIGNRLYVADVTEVAVINIKKGTVENRISVADAIALNDVTVADDGTIYVSDSRSGIVHQIINGIPSTYLTGFKGLNGLKAVGKNLYIATGKEVFKADENKNLTTFGMIDQGGDGIEPVGNGDFIGSAWSGYIYYLSANGNRELLLDTHEQKMNTADIGFDSAKKIVYVPTFFKKSVVAYQLK